MRRLKVLPIAIASIDENILVTVEAFPCPHDNASWFIVAGAIADEPRSILRRALNRLPRAHFLRSHHLRSRGASVGVRISANGLNVPSGWWNPVLVM